MSNTDTINWEGSVYEAEWVRKQLKNQVKFLKMKHRVDVKITPGIEGIYISGINGPNNPYCRMEFTNELERLDFITLLEKYDIPYKVIKEHQKFSIGTSTTTETPPGKNRTISMNYISFLHAVIDGVLPEFEELKNPMAFVQRSEPLSEDSNLLKYTVKKLLK